MVNQIAVGTIDRGSICEHRAVTVERQVRFDHKVILVSGGKVLIRAEKLDAKTGEVLDGTEWILGVGQSFQVVGVWEKVILQD